MPRLILSRLSGVPKYTKMALGALLLMAVIACSSSAPPTSVPAAKSAPTAEPAASSITSPESSSESIKVGVLHSLSGTMSISETAVRDATLMAIEEINADGGVMGKQLEVIVEDGASDWPTFAEKAKKLLQSDEVAVVFGGWTSASRKAMLLSLIHI